MRSWIELNYAKTCNPHPTQTLDAANTEGGFLWWYADLRGATGDGLVLIWSLGLPFLPEARNHAPAVTRPAVSIAHYVSGKQELYLLQDFDEGDAALDLATGSGRIGASTYRVWTVADEVHLDVVLDEPLPSSVDRLRGRIQLSGPATQIPRAGSSISAPHHLWAPQTLCASAQAILHYGGRDHVIEGTGYFDSNVSDTPLHEQGILSWRWGRISFERSTLVFYEVEEEGGLQRYLYEQGSASPMKRLSGRLSFSKEKSGRYGLSTPQETLIASTTTNVWAKSEALVEDGPFYSRSLLRALDDRGREGFGFSEVVSPKKIDRPWQRPLVRMRTHQIGRPNSPFLPLFNGPREGRTGRMLSSLWGRQLSA